VAGAINTGKTDTCAGDDDTPTSNATSFVHKTGHEAPHAAAIAEALSELDEADRAAVAEHVRRLATLPKAKRDAVLTLTVEDE